MRYLESKSKKISLQAGIVLLILLAIAMYQGIGTKNVTRTPQASSTTKPSTKPTPGKVTPTNPEKTPPIKVTPKPTPVKVTPTPNKPATKNTTKPTTKPSEKPTTPTKFGDVIPVSAIYPFPIVGEQIDPGYYYNTYDACSIITYNSKDVQVFENQTEPGEQVILNLKAGDQVQTFCKLYKGLPPVPSNGVYATGMHVINKDITPGGYIATNICYYWITKGNAVEEYTRGVIENIDTNYSAAQGAIITVPNLNEAIFFHNGCGPIKKIN